MAVNYKMIDEGAGYPPINVSGDTTARINLGTIVIGIDTSSAGVGVGEFMYVKFSGTVAAGDLVSVNRQANTAVQSPTSATKGVFGIAMGAQAANQYGYVMIRGIHDAANVITGSGTPDFGAVYGSALTAGRITNAVTANYILDGMAIRVQGASNVGTVELYWPLVSGR